MMEPLKSRIRSIGALALLACLLASCGEGPGACPLGSCEEPVTGAIVGLVTDAGTGEPLAGATVVTAPATSVARTDAAGGYRLERLAPGSYAVTATKEGFGAAAASAVVSPDATTQVDLAISALAAGQPAPTGAVTGLVLLADGRPAPAGTAVELVRDAQACGASATVVTATDPAGRFLAQGLAGGAYLACVKATIGGREVTGRAAFAVEMGKTAQADITLQGVLAGSPVDVDGEAVVSLGDTVRYTFTIVADGFGSSREVIVADTLPLLDDPAGPPGPRDRDGDQAFRYITDRPTFDPDGIRYYIDIGDDDAGTQTDYCLEVFPEDAADFPTPALCQTGSDPSANASLPSIEAARDSAEAASAAGDQVVIVEYFDAEILSRTPPAGEIEAEDSFEITVQAIHSVNEFRLDDGSIPALGDENGEWCNIVTATSAENDFVTRSTCTRVVEALLDTRKTVSDALVPAGSQAEFTVEIGNNGSEDLESITIVETLDPGLDLVMEEELCAGCTIDFGADSSAVTIVIPLVPPTDDAVSQAGEPLGDADGVLDDGEGFFVVRLVTRTPLEEGTFCNRVAVSDEDGRSDSDVTCVRTTAQIEFDIDHIDARRNPAGDLEDVETFQAGDTVVYLTSIRNNSDVAAVSVSVTWEVAAGNGLLQFLAIEGIASHAEIACDPTGGPTGSGRCTVALPILGSDESIVLNYRTIAESPGNDVNRLILLADPLALAVVNEEPTAILP